VLIVPEISKIVIFSPITESLEKLKCSWCLKLVKPSQVFDLVKLLNIIKVSRTIFVFIIMIRSLLFAPCCVKRLLLIGQSTQRFNWNISKTRDVLNVDLTEADPRHAPKYVTTI
jgi:hypothetical protein